MRHGHQHYWQHLRGMYQSRYRREELRRAEAVWAAHPVPLLLAEPTQTRFGGEPQSGGGSSSVWDCEDCGAPGEDCLCYVEPCER